jgi:hypothetical protein
VIATIALQRIALPLVRSQRSLDNYLRGARVIKRSLVFARRILKVAISAKNPRTRAHGRKRSPPIAPYARFRASATHTIHEKLTNQLIEKQIPPSREHARTLLRLPAANARDYPAGISPAWMAEASQPTTLINIIMITRIMPRGESSSADSIGDALGVIISGQIGASPIPRAGALINPPANLVR